MSRVEEYDRCEHCDRPRLDGELLSAIDCWVISQRDGRRRPSYWVVCHDCYDTRHRWEFDAFPDACERCGSKIQEGEHYFEKEVNRDGERIVSNGLARDETCDIICEDCYQAISTPRL